MKQFKIMGSAAAIVLGGMWAQAAGAADPNWDKIVDAAKKESVVVAASSSLGGGAAVSVMKALKEKTGVSLELFTGRMAVAQEKIQTEQKSRSYVTDAMDSGGMNVLLLKKAGYLDSLTKDPLPVFSEKDKFKAPLSEDPEAEVVNILEVRTYVCVNTDLVKAGDEPKSYRDLLDPKWKDKIFLTNPLYTTAPEEQMLAFTKAKTGLDEDYFVKLYKNSLVGGTGGGDEAMDKLVRGEVAIAGFFPGQTCIKPMLAGAPVRPLDLKEGILSKPMRWGLVKNAPHPNATKVFLNWLLSKDGQAFVTKETGMESVRNDVPSPLPLRFEGPTIRQSFDDLAEAEQRRSKNYMANLVGLKK